MTATTHHTDHDHLRTVLEQNRDDRRAVLQSISTDELQAVETDPAVAARISSARRTLQEVEEALVRMDAGEFGICVHCGDPIPVERLEFLPHASGCVPCVQTQRRH